MNRGRFGRREAPVLPGMPCGQAAANQLLSRAQHVLLALPGNHEDSVVQVGTYRLAIDLTGHLPCETTRARLGGAPGLPPAGER